MPKDTVFKFISWEGDVYRIDDIADDGFEVFVLKDGAWTSASNKLGATILYEGREVSDPLAQSFLSTPKKKKPDKKLVVMIPTAGKTKEQMKRDAIKAFRKAGLLESKKKKNNKHRGNN